MSLISSKVEDVFGKIQAPSPIAQFNQSDLTGAAGISNFLNATIVLIYMVAAIAVVFMLLWGALEWILSGGDQEKLESAQKRITNAIIGLVLLAIVFAFLSMLGTFTGFKFFNLESRPRPETPYCNTGFQRNPDTGVCEPLEIKDPNLIQGSGSCGSFEFFNPDTNKCEPTTEPE